MKKLLMNFVAVAVLLLAAGNNVFAQKKTNILVF
jgi:hypothetical protein